MTFIYEPKGVCSKYFEVELEGDTIQEVRIIGGCDGNLQGITSLLRGSNAREAISRLANIRCGSKTTSCPDQLSKAIDKALKEQKVEISPHK